VYVCVNVCTNEKKTGLMSTTEQTPIIDEEDPYPSSPHPELSQTFVMRILFGVVMTFAVIRFAVYMMDTIYPTYIRW